MPGIHQGDVIDLRRLFGVQYFVHDGLGRMLGGGDGGGGTDAGGDGGVVRDDEGLVGGHVLLVQDHLDVLQDLLGGGLWKKRERERERERVIY